MAAARYIMAVKVICVIVTIILKARYQRGLNFMVDFPILDIWPCASTDFILLQRIQQCIYRSRILNHLQSKVFVGLENKY